MAIACNKYALVDPSASLYVGDLNGLDYGKDSAGRSYVDYQTISNVVVEMKLWLTIVGLLTSVPGKASTDDLMICRMLKMLIYSRLLESTKLVSRGAPNTSRRPSVVFAPDGDTSTWRKHQRISGRNQIPWRWIKQHESPKNCCWWGGATEPANSNSRTAPERKQGNLIDIFVFFIESIWNLRHCKKSRQKGNQLGTD